jgi:hypothetical protein
MMFFLPFHLIILTLLASAAAASLFIGSSTIFLHLGQKSEFYCCLGTLRLSDTTVFMAALLSATEFTIKSYE